MKNFFILTVLSTMLLVFWGQNVAAVGPQVTFEEPTPVHGATIPDTSTEITVSILEESTDYLDDLIGLQFNWNGTDYTLYDDSLVLMFNFDNVAALGESYIAEGLVKDVSGAGNDGYLYSSPGIPQWIPNGRYGGAFDFAGNGINTGQSILVYHSDSLNPYNGDFAITVWILTKDDYDGDVLRKGSTNTASTWYKVEHSPSSDNNRLSLNFNTTEVNRTINSINAYNDYKWHFVVTQRRGNQAQLWIDGLLDGSASVSGSISNYANLAVGSKDTQNDDFINSALDEVRIYMRSFSESEIKELYYSNLAKYDIDKWTLYVNQSDLTEGSYTYQASASDAETTNSTEQRDLTVDFSFVMPIKGPYLQQVTTDSIVIMWETDTATTGWVDFGLAAPDEFYVEDLTPVTIHEMLLTGLTPDTTYYYKVTSDGSTTSTSTFATAPDTERSFRFVVYGDTDMYPDDHAAVIQAIINSGPEIVIHTGDFVTNGRNYEEWGPQFFDPAHDLMVNTPLLGVPGNNDYEGTGPLWFFDFFSLPNNEEWFAFTYGGVRFIGLNTMADFSPASLQYDWLVSEFQSTDYNSATWHVVYFHDSPYTACSEQGENTDVQAYLVPLFEQYGVDVVFSGYSHVYERYFHNNVFYIVTGGGGAGLHTLVNDTVEPIREAGESVHHHCVIDVTTTSLTCTALRNDESEIDQIFISNLIFNDSFESGSFAAGGWQTGTNASVKGPAAYTGLYGAELKYSATIEKAISTVGYSNIHIKYARITGRMEAGELLYAEWFDGQSWNILEQTQDESWAIQNLSCGAGADNNANFKLRFRTIADKLNEYAYIDDIEITGKRTGPDTTAPIPNPMTWATPPYATGSNSISMVATTASDTSGVEYYFECTTVGGHDSGWQDSPIYEDTDLTAGTQYSYRVQARDKSPNQNETGWSIPASAIPIDVPPSAPTGLAAVPGDSQVNLNWDDNTESDLAGYNVYRSTTASGPYSKIAALLTTSDYTDPGLVNGTIYYYVVTSIDQAANESGYSNEVSATPNVQQMVYVQSIDMTVVPGKKYYATATVAITPGLDGAIVVGDWYFKGALRKSGATAVTNTSGIAVFASFTTPGKTGDTFMFVVTDIVISGYTYDDSLNVETSDSIAVP
jgi:predicted phosphodiesterase